jgi:hypothetical protein
MDLTNVFTFRIIGIALAGFCGGIQRATKIGESFELSPIFCISSTFEAAEATAPR